MSDMKATINEQGILLSALANKYLDVIKRGIITNNEIIALCSFMNNKATKEEKRELSSFLADNTLMLTNEQNKKGIDFLNNLWKSPKGKERLNNPFGYRERRAVETFTHFELIGLYNASNMQRDYFLPLYACVGTDGYFEYYYNGKMNIIG